MNNAKIIFLYFFLLAGGMWHLLGMFQELMRILAGPLLIGLAIWLLLEYLPGDEPKSERRSARISLLQNWRRQSRLVLWFLLVVVLSFSVEWLGVKTGLIFGEYDYGDTLQPLIFGIPLAIGFAWAGMILASVAVVQRFHPGISGRGDGYFAFWVSLVMVLFDMAMEPAAIRLTYWTWAGGEVPLQNYLGWFVTSFILVLAGRWLQLLRKPLPALAFHAFWAQLGYFVLVIMAKSNS